MVLNGKKALKLSRLIWLVLLLSYAVLIFYLSSQSGESLPVPQLFPNQDKVMHLIEYAGLGWLAMKTLQPLNRAGFIACVGFFMVFAALDEVHQAFVPGRDADVMDWLADAAGILISSCIYYKYYMKK